MPLPHGIGHYPTNTTLDDYRPPNSAGKRNISLVTPGQLLAGGDDGARVLLRNADGQPVGVVRLNQERDGKVLIRANVHDVPSGFHGFHVHTVGSCEPPFTSAGGYLNPAGHSHPDHAADLPVLLVNQDGTGELRVKTDRFAVADLFDAAVADHQV